jgi:hypothetical protein
MADEAVAATAFMLRSVDVSPITGAKQRDFYLK